MFHPRDELDTQLHLCRPQGELGTQSHVFHPQGELAQAKKRIQELEARNAQLENELQQHVLATKLKRDENPFTLPDPNKIPRLHMFALLSQPSHPP